MGTNKTTVKNSGHLEGSKKERADATHSTRRTIANSQKLLAQGNALTDDFKWRCLDGRILEVQHMVTTHLFYCVRMIFNHSIPPSFQIPGCRRYDFSMISMERRLISLTHLLLELQSRSDLPQWMWREMEYMREAASRMDNKQLTSDFSYDSHCKPKIPPWFQDNERRRLF